MANVDSKGSYTVEVFPESIVIKTGAGFITCTSPDDLWRTLQGQRAEALNTPRGGVSKFVPGQGRPDTSGDLDTYRKAGVKVTKVYAGNELTLDRLKEMMGSK